MENVIKALEIAAGLLLGVLIMALVSRFFTYIKSWPEQEDNNAKVEQLMQFNKEYEVFEKKVMYGTDIISCLNKAKNNNEKYVLSLYKKSNLSGSKVTNLGGGKYLDIINIYVNFKETTKLAEDVEIYYKPLYGYVNGVKNSTQAAGERLAFSTNDFGSAVANKTMKDLGFNNLPDTAGGDPRSALGKTTTVKQLFDMKSGSTNSLEVPVTDIFGSSTTMKINGVEKKYYSLCTGSGKDIKTNPKFEKFLEMTTDLTQKVYNKEITNDNNWTSAIWHTRAYYFKKLKFTCDYVAYEPSTGRIIEMYFSEVSKEDVK